MNRPLGITVVAIVLAISGVVSILIGLVGMDILPIDLGDLPDGAGAVGIGAIVSGALALLVSWGMWSTAGWAWVLTVAVMVLRIVFDLWAIITHGLGSALGGAAVANLVISAIILWYFFRPNVRSAFGS